MNKLLLIIVVFAEISFAVSPKTNEIIFKSLKIDVSQIGDEICDSIYAALDDYSIPRTSLHVYFPKFIRQNALNFVGSKNSLWWWEYDVWDTGRMDFLNWLIGQYKDDKTNLRKL